jgi:hypothetical protein
VRWLGPLLSNVPPGERTVALIQQWRRLTPALAQQAPQVSALEAVAPGDVAEALGNLLTFAAAQFNVGKNLNDVQIALLASEMLRLYWHWRFHEFSLMLREAVAGRYGTTYDRIDAPTVHEWCAKYEADRNATQAYQAEHEARAYKQAEQQAPRSELAAHPKFGADYADVRAQLEVLCDGELNATWRHYLTAQRADNKFIAAVATEVVNERRKAHYLRQLSARVQNAPARVPTLQEQMYQQMQATRARLNAKLLGENSPVWGIAQHWRDIIDVESEPIELPVGLTPPQYTIGSLAPDATTPSNPVMAIAS